MTDPVIIEMSLTCDDCGQRVHNDIPEIQHPIDFLRECEARGWSAPVLPVPRPPKCPTCNRKGG